jgi:hypothetical protein
MESGLDFKDSLQLEHARARRDDLPSALFA